MRETLWGTYPSIARHLQLVIATVSICLKMLYGLVICPERAHSSLWTARDLFRVLIALVSCWRCYSLWLHRRLVLLKYITPPQQNANILSSDD